MNNLINIELDRQAEEIYTFESRGTVNQFIDITSHNSFSLSFSLFLFFFYYMPCFPFPYVDKFWYVNSGSIAFFHHSDKFINEARVSVPEPVAKLLEKGPNFRVPPKLNKRLYENIDLSLEVLTYRLRWFEALKNVPESNHRKIPFPKNSVSLPPKMEENREKELTAQKQKVLRAAKCEMAKMHG